MVNIHSLVAAPVFADEDKTRIAQILNFCLLVVLFGAGLFAVATPIIMPERLSRLPISLFAVFVSFVMLGLLRLGYVRITALLFSTILWLLFSYAAFTSGGIQHPGFSLQFLVVVIATLTLGGRTALGFALLSGLFGAGMYLAQETGTLPVPLITFQPTASIITQLVSMFAIALLMYRADRSIIDALTRTRQSERALAERNRQLESEIVERKRVEAALRDSQTSLTDAHVIANIGTWESDLLTGEEIWSDEIYRQLGFEPGQQIPQFALFVSRVHPEDRHLIERKTDPVLTETNNPVDVQYRVIHPNGEIRYLSSRSNVKYDAAGRPLRFVGLTQDITTQKQAEIELQDREEQLRLATDAARIGIWDWNVLTDVVIWSDHAYRIFGLERGAIGESSMEFESRVYPPDLPLVQNTLGRADAHGYLNLGDYRIVHSDGSLRWVHEQSKVYYDEAGQPVRVIGVIQDVTAQKQAEIALQDREEQLRLATDAARIGIWDLNITTQVVKWSDHTYRIFGLSHDAFGESRMDFYSRVYPEDLPIIQNILDRADADGHIDSGDFRIIHSDGSLRWVYEQGKVYYDAAGQQRRVIGVIQDITERKQVEQKLREQTEILQAIFDNVPLMIAVFDAQWNFKLVNRGWEQIMGWRLDELQNDPNILRGIYPDSDRLQQTTNFITEATSKWDDFVTTVRDGRELDTVWANIRLSNDMLIGIGQDITERKQAEKQRLELAVERERVGLLKEFIGNMSHDLKTPLTVLNTSLYLLERLSDPMHQQTRIASMKQQILLLQSLIEDILTMSRLDHTPEFTLESVNLNDLLYDVEHKLHPAVEHKRLVLTMEFDNHKPYVLANESELYRVMVNLVENAIKYTPISGTVTIRTRQEGSQAVTEIADSGIGIGADELPHIFDRFYRADEARSTDTPGTGLGLAIVKRIVDMHNGGLNVDSIPGKGSIFRVSLPLAQ